MRYRILDMFCLNCNNGVPPFDVLVNGFREGCCIVSLGNVGVSIRNGVKPVCRKMTFDRIRFAKVSTSGNVLLCIVGNIR